MVRPVVWFAAGTVIGMAAILAAYPALLATAPPLAAQPAADPGLAPRVAELEAQLTELTAAFALLSGRLAELDAGLASTTRGQPAGDANAAEFAELTSLFQGGDFQLLPTVRGDYRVNVMAVFEDSQAAAAGLQTGDQILWYAGKRVLDVAEMPFLTAEGVEGEPVTLEILRAGVPMQFVVPRGELGVRLNAVFVPDAANTSRR
jgi:hypothetical protein